MKAALIAALIAAAATAQAAPITIAIGPAPGCYGFCYNVPNNAGAVIDMSPPHVYGQPATLYVSINGVGYTGALPLNDTSYSNIVLSDVDGNEITVSASWVGSRHCSSGHPGCSTVWALQSGSIVLP